MFEREFPLKDTKFPVKIKNIYKIEKTSYISISIFGYENKEKYPIYASRNTFKKHIDLLLLEKKNRKDTMFLSKILIHLCMTIHYTIEENIFFVDYKLLVQKKY